MSDDFKVEVWPADSRQITQPFGVNAAFYAKFGTPGHMGIDLGGQEGVTKIYAVAPGKVSKTGFEANGYGHHAYVQHANGYTTIYGHLHTLAVKQGDNVAAGAEIGRLGNTGASSGPHLHFELRGPRPVPNWPRNITDPTPYLAPLMGFTRPAGPYKSGWVAEWVITLQGELAQANSGGISLRAAADQNAQRLAVVPEGGVMVITGAKQKGFYPVDVPLVTIGETPPVPKPAPEFPPMVSTIDGWAFTTYITPDASGVRATVGQYGINLRSDPRRDGILIGLVKGGAQVTITGAVSGEYTPVKAARNDFVGEVNMVQSSPPKPAAGVLSAHTGVSETTCLGWGWTQYMELRGEKAVVGQYGINLRAQPNEFGSQIGVVKGLSVVTIAGKADGDYTPVLVDRTDMISIVPNPPKVQTPKPIGATAAAAAPPPPPITEPTPPEKSIPGWAFTSATSVRGSVAIPGQYGINLRDAPRRDGANIGFVAAGVEMLVVGAPQGEYIPVRVATNLVNAPATAGTAVPATAPISAAAGGTPAPIAPPPPVDKPLIGQARIGLHASATPDISAAEIAEFKALRPGMIKVLSFHDPNAIQQLAKDHPDAHWVVRAFLSFGNRNISPDQFVNDTIGDTKRTLAALQGKNVVVELHNEPNLTVEGLKSTWADGRAFNQWWLQVLGKYRQQLPNVRYIFPGLSPGPDAPNLRQADRPFLEACRPSIEAADGLGMHSYWSNPHFNMMTHPDSGIPLVDDYIRRFPNKQIWVTEASNNLGNDWNTKAREYMQFWQELQKRPPVQGVTYFVASAAPGTFDHEVWVGHGIAAQLGAR